MRVRATVTRGTEGQRTRTLGVIRQGLPSHTSVTSSGTIKKQAKPFRGSAEFHLKKLASRIAKTFAKDSPGNQTSKLLLLLIAHHSDDLVTKAIQPRAKYLHFRSANFLDIATFGFSPSANPELQPDEEDFVTMLKVRNQI